jgi:hypothetical protein
MQRQEAGRLGGEGPTEADRSRFDKVMKWTWPGCRLSCSGSRSARVRELEFGNFTNQVTVIVELSG